MRLQSSLLFSNLGVRVLGVFIQIGEQLLERGEMFARPLNLVVVQQRDAVVQVEQVVAMERAGLANARIAKLNVRHLSISMAFS